MTARNTSTLNLGGDDGMFGLNDPTPPTAKQSQSAAESTQTTQNSGSGPNNTPGKKPPGQEQNGEVYRYPYTKFQPGQDMLKISIFEYEPNNNLNLESFASGAITGGEVIPSDGIAGGTPSYQKPYNVNISQLNIPSFSDSFKKLGGETKGKLKKNARHIFLPIPQRISDSLSVGYGQDTLSPLDAAAVSGVSDLISANGGGAGKIANMAKRFATVPNSVTFSGADNGEMTALKTGLAAQIVNSVGRNVSADALISRASGQILQSNLELLFSSVTLRSFPFVFDFTPRDELESIEVKKIIRAIKYAMSPSNGASTQGGTGGILLKAPDLFTFEYMSGKSRHPFLNSFKIGVLTDMKVDYTASGTYATYAGSLKSPVHMRMTLQFSEINPVYKEDYEREGNEMPGVGY